MALSLCLDCGNTRLKWGLHDGELWLARGAVLLTELDQPDALHQLSDALAAALQGRPLERILGCLVANETVRGRLAAYALKLQLPLVWNESRPSQAGVVNGYSQPEQLGADRWAALIGARKLHAGPALVVMAGTATTIDHLSADGHFLGGLILPGLDMMRRSLNQQTARLPLQEASFAALPQDTATAISSGCLQATVGAIMRMFQPMQAEAGALCLVSGGAAASLLHLLDIPWRHVENLALEGLAHIAAGDSTL